MMTVPVVCVRTDPHPAHEAHGWIGGPVQCPGVDPEPLAPERDRPAQPEFDWQPENLNLSAAAALVVGTFNDFTRSGNYDDEILTKYHAQMGLWAELTGMDEATALTYAYQIADAVPPVMGTAVPF